MFLTEHDFSITFRYALVNCFSWMFLGPTAAVKWFWTQWAAQWAHSIASGSVWNSLSEDIATPSVPRASVHAICANSCPRDTVVGKSILTLAKCLQFPWNGCTQAWSTPPRHTALHTTEGWITIKFPQLLHCESHFWKNVSRDPYLSLSKTSNSWSPGRWEK